MNKMQQQVVEFMTLVKGLTLPDKPALQGNSIASLCQSLIKEELLELKGHLGTNGQEQNLLMAIADDLADLLYVVLYTANAYGIDIEPIFDEVHRSNMTKIGGPKREDGKILKPDTYEPPQLEPLIKAQMED